MSAYVFNSYLELGTRHSGNGDQKVAYCWNANSTRSLNLSVTSIRQPDIFPPFKNWTSPVFECLLHNDDLKMAPKF